MSVIRESIPVILQELQAPLIQMQELGEGENDFLRIRGVGSLLREAEKSPEEIPFALEQLTAAIATPDPFQGGRAALICGILVEYGGDPNIAGPAILEQLPSVLELAGRITPDADPDTHDQPLFDADPLAFKAWRAVRFWLLPIMTMAARSVGLRRIARTRPEFWDLLSPLEERIAEANYLKMLLELVDDLELIVLHPVEMKGYRVRLEAVGRCFHLFTLLQDALIGDPGEGWLRGVRPDPQVAAMAKGEAFSSDRGFDSEVWQFYNWAGWTPARGYDQNMGTWVWGEMRPDEIPAILEEPTVILGPPAMRSRTWACNFFPLLHDALRSKVEILERFTPEQVQTHLERLIAEREKMADE